MLKNLSRPFGYSLLAAYYEKTYQSDKAIAELKQVIAINPSVRGAHFTPCIHL